MNGMNRRVVLLTVGTRGDVDPFCALALELLNRDTVEKQNGDPSSVQKLHVDFFLQENLVPVARHLLPLNNSSTDSATKIRLHALPFTNQDFYSAVASASSSSRKNDNDDVADEFDPRLKSVAQVAAIVSSLVLPCYDQVEEVILKGAITTAATAAAATTTTATTYPTRSEDADDDDSDQSELTPNNNKTNTTNVVTTRREDDDDGVEETVIVTSSLFTRPLAFLLAKVHCDSNVRVVVVHLQPTIPNTLFPNYRVSVQDFVRAIMKHDSKNNNYSNDGTTSDTASDSDHQPATATVAAPLLDCFSVADDHDKNQSKNHYYAETYWRIEKALECQFLGHRLQSMYKEKVKNRERRNINVDVEQPSTGNSRYYIWEELQQILTGRHGQFQMVNAYSNHLVPPILNSHNNDVFLPQEVGPLADAYLPPGTPSSSLVDFLYNHTHGRGRRPICVGFGSMKFSQLQTLLEALEFIQQPAVLVGSSLRITAVGRDSGLESHHRPQRQLQATTFVESHIRLVYWVSHIPYTWLLPRCSMMLCHGGAGVVHACLRAGIPSVVLPFMGDQFAWGALLEAKGLGLVIHHRRPTSSASTVSSVLSAQDFVDPIQTILNSVDDDDEGIGARCRRLGTTIRQQPRSGAALLADIVLSEENSYS